MNLELSFWNFLKIMSYMSLIDAGVMAISGPHLLVLTALCSPLQLCTRVGLYEQ